MTRSRILAATLIMALASVHTLQAQTLLETVTSNINIEGLETTFDPETGVATAKGDVYIKYGDTEIRSGEADYNANTGEVIARKDVTIWKAGATYKGENIMYNVKTNELTGNLVKSGLTHGSGTLLYTMEKFDTETKFLDQINGEQSTFTTHDYANPNYHVKAREITIYPDDRVVMKRVTVYAGKTPVFWFPYISQPLDDEVGYTFTPGYSSTWGAFLLNQYGVIHGDHTLAKYKFDLRSTRGVAGGVDFISLRNKEHEEHFGTLKLYYANDTDPGQTGSGEIREELDSGRYRVNFQHRIYLPGPEKSTWYLDFDINKLSDIHFYEDFFFEEFRTNREPDNQISLIHTDDRYVATLMAKFQLNDFYRTDTRLPELSFDFTRQPLWNSGVFYQGNTSFGLYKEKYSTSEIAENKALIASGEAFLKNNGLNQKAVIDPETGLPSTAPIDQAGYRRVLGLEDGTELGVDEVTEGLEILKARSGEPGFTRLHSYHEFLYPKTFGGWLNVVPRIGGGATMYSDVEGGAKGVGDETRGIFHAGLDVSFKATRTWDEVHNERLGLDGLRHMLRPYLNYSYLNADHQEGFPSIDRLVPTTRPRSIDVPLFTAVDDLRTWNVARVGLQQLWQTKRDYQSYDASQSRFRAANDAATQTYNWAGLNTYVDLFIDDPEFDRDMSNLYNEIFWRPLPWLTFWADTQLPIGGSDANFTELNHGFTFMPAKAITFTLGHQFISDHPLFEDSSLFYSRIHARLSENWGFSMNHVYEVDDGTLEYQSYSVHRDLSSWVASLGAMIRDSRGGVDDFGLVFSLTLKDFPQVSVPLDMDPNPTGRGGRR
jgi:LPS-assembly protein